MCPKIKSLQFKFNFKSQESIQPKKIAIKPKAKLEEKKSELNNRLKDDDSLQSNSSLFSDNFETSLDQQNSIRNKTEAEKWSNYQLLFFKGNDVRVKPLK